MNATELRSTALAGVLIAVSIATAQPPQLTVNSSGLQMLSVAISLAEACDRDTAVFTLVIMSDTLWRAGRKTQADELLDRARILLDKTTDPVARAEGYLTLLERLSARQPGGGRFILPVAVQIIEGLPPDTAGRAKLLAELSSIQVDYGEQASAERNLKTAFQAVMAMRSDTLDAQAAAVLAVIRSRLYLGPKPDQPPAEATAEIPYLRMLLERANAEQKKSYGLALMEVLALSPDGLKLARQCWEQIAPTLAVGEERNQGLSRLVVALVEGGHPYAEVRRLAELADTPAIRGELLLRISHQLWHRKKSAEANTAFAEGYQHLAKTPTQPSPGTQLMLVTGLVRTGKLKEAVQLVEGSAPGPTAEAAHLAGERRLHLCQELISAGRLDEARKLIVPSGLPAQQRRMMLMVASAHLKKGETQDAAELLEAVARLEQERAREVDVIDGGGPLRPAVMAELAAVLAEREMDLSPARKQLAAAWLEARGRIPPGIFGDQLRAAMAQEIARVAAVALP